MFFVVALIRFLILLDLAPYSDPASATGSRIQGTKLWRKYSNICLLDNIKTEDCKKSQQFYIVFQYKKDGKKYK